MAHINQDNLDDAFTYHAPEGDQPARYSNISKAAKAFAAVVLENAPESADRNHVLRLIRDARMWANAAIACKGQY